MFREGFAMVSKVSIVSTASKVRYLLLSLRAQGVAASPLAAQRLIIHVASPLATQESNGNRTAASRIKAAART